MKQCPNGHSVDDNARFCPTCGIEIAGAKYCTECGKELVGTEKYCPQCGNEMTTAQAQLEKEKLEKERLDVLFGSDADYYDDDNRAYQRKNKLWIILVIVLVGCVIGGGYYFYQKQQKNEEKIKQLIANQHEEEQRKNIEDITSPDNIFYNQIINGGKDRVFLGQSVGSLQGLYMALVFYPTNKNSGKVSVLYFSDSMYRTLIRQYSQNVSYSVSGDIVSFEIRIGGDYDKFNLKIDFGFSKQLSRVEKHQLFFEELSSLEDAVIGTVTSGSPSRIIDPFTP